MFFLHASRFPLDVDVKKWEAHEEQEEEEEAENDDDEE